MAVTVLALHHHGIRVPPDVTERCRDFYGRVLGLDPDPGRPAIPGIPGYWMDVDDATQIHVMGCDGMSRYALEGDPHKDPTRFHVALAVPDVQEAKRELGRMGVAFWTVKSVVGPDLEQIFLDDPAGNLVELHQVDTCRCRRGARLDPPPAR
jgi:catechol 2,3-dioxygenase-like lactoylglutathione lyase family enzyme